MSDRAYILMRTIEPQLAIAENNGMHEIWMTTGFVHEIVDVLKEQEDLGTELTNAVELIHKKNERIEKLLKEQKFLVNSDGKITPLPVVVRCKDCKYGSLWENVIVCDKLSKTRNKNWFCADGERRTDDA